MDGNKNMKTNLNGLEHLPSLTKVSGSCREESGSTHLLRVLQNFLNNKRQLEIRLLT